MTEQAMKHFTRPLSPEPVDRGVLVSPNSGRHSWITRRGVGHSPTALSDSRLYRFQRAANTVASARGFAPRRMMDDLPPLVRRLAF